MKRHEVTALPRSTLYVRCDVDVANAAAVVADDVIIVIAWHFWSNCFRETLRVWVRFHLWTKIGGLTPNSIHCDGSLPIVLLFTNYFRRKTTKKDEIFMNFMKEWKHVFCTAVNVWKRWKQQSTKQKRSRLCTKCTSDGWMDGCMASSFLLWFLKFSSVFFIISLSLLTFRISLIRGELKGRSASDRRCSLALFLSLSPHSNRIASITENCRGICINTLYNESDSGKKNLENPISALVLKTRVSCALVGRFLFALKACLLIFENALCMRITNSSEWWLSTWPASVFRSRQKVVSNNKERRSVFHADSFHINFRLLFICGNNWARQHLLDICSVKLCRRSVLS